MIEQVRITSRVQLAAGLVIADRIRLQLGAVAVDEALAPQEDRLTVALHDQRLGDISRDAKALDLEQRINDGIGRGKTAGGSGGQSEAAGSRGVHAAAAPQRVLRSPPPPPPPPTSGD